MSFNIEEFKILLEPFGTLKYAQIFEQDARSREKHLLATPWGRLVAKQEEKLIWAGKNLLSYHIIN